MNGIVMDIPLISSPQKEKLFPQKTGAKTLAQPANPKDNPTAKYIINSIDTLIYRLDKSLSLFTTKFDILGSITVPNADTTVIGILITFSAFS